MTWRMARLLPPSFLLTLAFISQLFFANGLPDARQQPWLKWGPYRPNLYLGIRPQIPEALLMGLMWANGESRSSILHSLRDTCQEDDSISDYGWTMYDTRTGGSQLIHDSQLHVDLSTQFIKSSDGESWSLRVSGAPRPDAPGKGTPPRIALIFHVALEKAETNGTGKSLTCRTASGLEDTGKGTAVCNGSDPALGDFQLQFHTPGNGSVVIGPSIKSLVISERQIWQAKSVFTHHAPDIFQSSHTGGSGNMQFVGLVADAPFTFDVHFSSPLSQVPPTMGDLSLRLDEFQASFPARVDDVFPRSAPFKRAEFHNLTMSLLSNLLGGLAFLYGDSKVDESRAPEYDETDIRFWEGATAAMARAKITKAAPAALLSHTPSRPFFPRGFLWDEGFHLLPVIEWDIDLAVDVIRSWLGLMDEDGWIGREQILGPEARNKVPEKFQVQYPHYANPPTLILLIPPILSKLTNRSPYRGNPSVYMASEEATSSLLHEMYPLLTRHYAWFCRTQAGNFTDAYPRPDGVVAGQGYRWRGRTPSLTLTSGLDDYPRPNPPHPGELHIDALAWVAAAAGAIQQLAEYLDKSADAALYAEQATGARKNIDILHWDETEKVYCDATVVEGEFKRVCHQGYISLMPLLLGLMGSYHPNLPTVLDLLSDPQRLWSSHGIRSLSAKDPKYGRNENYWRGAIWMNMNVLAVLRLRDLGVQDGPEQARAGQLAATLCNNVVKTVYNSWAKTGFVWEQYSDKTGEGRRSRAFTGWTACILLLMGLDGSNGREEVDNGGKWRAGQGIELLGTPTVVCVVGFMILVAILRRRIRRFLHAGLQSIEGWRQVG